VVATGKWRCGKGFEGLCPVSTESSRRKPKAERRSGGVPRVPVDLVYRSALSAASELGPEASLSREGAGRALTSTLERAGVDVLPIGERQVWTLGEDDGIVVGVEGEERAGEIVPLLRQHRWQRVHLIVFGARSVTIRTISG
jgi:hypothetical protein